MIRPVRFVCDYFFGTEGRKLYRYEQQIIREFGQHLKPEVLQDNISESRKRESLYVYAGKVIPNGFLIGTIASIAIWGWKNPPYLLLFTEGVRWMLMYENGVNLRKLSQKYRSQLIENSELAQKIDQIKREDKEGEEWKQ